MKHLAFAVLLIAACGSKETAATATDTVSTSGTETTGTASKTSTGSSGGTISSLNAEDKQFFIAAAKANETEVNAARMAADQATDARVKSFASRLLTDHSQADQELKQLALRKGVALPNPVSNVPSDLSSIAGRDFDRAYINEMVRDHEKAVSDFQSAATNTKDPDLRAWAAKMLPTLQDHLVSAKKIQANLR